MSKLVTFFKMSFPLLLIIFYPEGAISLRSSQKEKANMKLHCRSVLGIFKLNIFNEFTNTIKVATNF